MYGNLACTAGRRQAHDAGIVFKRGAAVAVRERDHDDLWPQTEQARRKGAASGRHEKHSEQVQLDLLLATAKLSYAVAMAMKNGHPNGEVEEGVEQYKNAMRSFKKFERELIVENGGTSHDV